MSAIRIASVLGLVGHAVVGLGAVGCSGSEAAVEGASGATVGADASAVLVGGNSDAIEIVTLYDAPTLSATDLAFNPSHSGELWAVLRYAAYAGDPCVDPENLDSGVPYDAEACALLQGSVVVVEQAPSASPRTTVLQDDNAWHFMRLPTGIAFADNDEFATSAEARTGNWDDSAIDFIGPSLWSADPTVFGPTGPGGNGSHLDMLHASPFAMGIAHEAARVYWVMNGQVGAVDRYDFVDPHVPGGADHTDGSAVRFLLGELERVPGIPSHLEVVGRDLFIADTGNRRVLRLDTESGAFGPPLYAPDPALDEQIDQVVDATFDVVVPPGVVEAPSGVLVRGETLYVTDNATGVIFAFDTNGDEQLRLDTGLGAGVVAGIDVGPDGRAYLALLDGRVVRIDPR